MCYLGAFSSCNGDTWASELATVLDTGLPILITTGKPVPKGDSLDLVILLGAVHCRTYVQNIQHRTKPHPNFKILVYPITAHN